MGDGRLLTADCRLLTVDCQLNRPRGAAAFEVSGLDRVGQALSQIGVAFSTSRDAGPSELEAIHNHLQRRAACQRGGIDVVERDRAPIDEEAAEPLAPQRFDRGDDRGRAGPRRPSSRHNRRVHRTRPTYVAVRTRSTSRRMSLFGTSLFGT